MVAPDHSLSTFRSGWRTVSASPAPLLVVRQSRRRRYRVRRDPANRRSPANPRPASSRSEYDWENLASRLEQSPEYQQLLAKLVALSGQFQRTLSRKQHKQWLKLEDALFAHTWFLHGEFFKAGYQLGRVAGGKRSSQAHDHRSPALLLSALARLLDHLMEE